MGYNRFVSFNYVCVVSVLCGLCGYLVTSTSPLRDKHV